MPTTPDRPADQLRAAAVRARETGDPLLAAWLEAEAAPPITAQHSDRCTDPQCTTLAALAVARHLLGTSTGEDTAAVEPSADRRDRYAAAMALRDGHPEWPVRYEADERDYRRRADAVMAVADAEQAELRAQIANLRTMYNVANDRTNDLIDERDALLETPAAPPAPADRAATG
ncbi:hypothetical protein DBP19_36530, partial [Streptomyces sp. CS090A]|uniref:hypothetical protein n=1 Tax=Streptomyces sp. CS090A TaxID=2162710 RepID=UPI000D50FE09